VFRFATSVLILVFTVLSAVAMSGLCFFLENGGSHSSGIPSQIGDDKDCTCKMSSTEHNIALDVQWGLALLPVVDTTIHLTSMTLPPRTATGPQSFDTVIPTPPPKA
jgi:hypothetical protein